MAWNHKAVIPENLLCNAYQLSLGSFVPNVTEHCGACVQRAGSLYCSCKYVLLGSAQWKALSLCMTDADLDNCSDPQQMVVQGLQWSGSNSMCHFFLSGIDSQTLRFPPLSSNSCIYSTSWQNPNCHSSLPPLPLIRKPWALRFHRD